MKSILITGGAGYIGSHACKAVSAAGYRPVVLDNMSYGHEWAVQWGPMEQGDIRDQGFVERVIDQWNVTAVIHFAGLIQVGESVVNPEIYYQHNVGGTLSLLAAMRTKGLEQIVFSSTCAIFGLPETVPLSEDLPQHPINPYGSSKAMVEQMLQDFGTAYGMRSTALRYFNASGSDPAARIGEAHEPESHLIPLAIGAARGQRPPLKIFGDDYPTPDGTCIRDYVHVDDLADAHVLALAWLIEHPGFNTFNLGNGAGYSVRQVIDTVQRVSGLSVPHTMGPRRIGDPPILVADSAKARDILGWHPKQASLEEVIGSAWRWHNTQHGCLEQNRPH
jgi:UDP-arabinose 4-epimerase